MKNLRTSSNLLSGVGKNSRTLLVVSLCIFSMFACAGLHSKKSFYDLENCELLARKRIVHQNHKYNRIFKGKTRMPVVKGSNLHQSKKLNEVNSIVRLEDVIAPQKIKSDFLLDRPDADNPSTAPSHQPDVQNLKSEEVNDHQFESIAHSSITQNTVTHRPLESDQNSTMGVLLFFIIPTLISISLLSAFPSFFIKISAWAAHNPWSTRGILVGIHTASTLGAIAAGHYMAQLGMTVSNGLMACAGVTFLAGSVFYPSKSNSISTLSSDYIRQKLHDTSVFASAVALSLCVGNKVDFESIGVNPSAYVSNALDQTEPHEQFTASTPVIKQDPTPKKYGKIWLIVLASVGFTILELGVASLACYLICISSVSPAILVIMVGIGAIFGYSRILKNINKNRTIKPGKKKTATVPIENGA